ncbi:L-lysine exporter family protein LysE/ArgO [Agrococcus baldri]|uniref:L-lysine exporter family protein LysE/ArgO n=1 Tax=Agrococcus baldri TaxID=153730 RepID=A0AA94HNM2_9MICO|nr:LysE/ArgO family amino acid transporter [Agrococcus baldri]SFS15434.1 L-lysine exporter family protein LysE/ArgO [Agrococcus baldri]
MDQGIVALLSGFALCLGLILSIGAQNAIVLRQGLRREHVGIVVLVCVVSDAILQTIGVAGVATLVTAQPWLETLARWAGAAFILGFALLSARRAWRGGGSLEAAPDEPVEVRIVSTDAAAAEGEVATTDAAAAAHRDRAGESAGAAVATRTRPRGGRMATLLTILAVTWLNPHALVETTVVLGSVAGTHGDARWWFLAGGIAASTLWFVGFGYGARYLAPLLRTERAWRVLDGAIAAVMLVIAVMLVTG